MTDVGKRIFFDRYFHSSLSDEEGVRLDAIDRLAPGDFRTVCENLFISAKTAPMPNVFRSLRRNPQQKARFSPLSVSDERRKKVPSYPLICPRQSVSIVSPLIMAANARKKYVIVSKVGGFKEELVIHFTVQESLMQSLVVVIKSTPCRHLPKGYFLVIHSPIVL